MANGKLNFMVNRRQRRIKQKIIIVLIALVAFFAGIAAFYFFKSSPNLPLSKLVASQKEKESMNILLLGVGGGTHEGPDLTDTIIFANLDAKHQRVTLASIPRDLWIPELNGKVNSMYVAGEDKKAGSGLQTSKETIEKIIHQPIDHVVRLDFAGFTKGVDMMGGLDIDVERGFDDYAYPMEGKETDPCGNSDEMIASLSAQIASGSATEGDAFPCRYEHLHFNKGEVTMDGITALKYVRSRHALGPEGSDFARSKRQEKVIGAFKQKLFSAGTLLNPGKVIGLFTVLKDSIKTDIAPNEYGDLVNFIQKMKGAKITSAIIDQGDESEGRLGLLKDPQTREPYGGAWVVIPRAGDENYSEIQAYIACEITGSICIVGEDGIVTPTPKPTSTSSQK
jgi:LCP family protein required for cell wall assembly